MSTSTVSPLVVKAKALFCPNCGGPVELRGFAHTLTVVCPQCLSVLDATTPTFQILQTFQVKQRIEPKIPLGTRGKIGDILYEVIGFQVREIVSDDEVFTWDEYLLFNPYKGFRYLSEYNGHWNFIRVLSALPEQIRLRGRQGWRFDGRRYALFATSNAKTSYVLGEFPWRVEVGEMVRVEDYISPPYMLSAEKTDGEVAWSRGEYWTGSQVWQAFRPPGSPPSVSGVFANQPSPHVRVRAAWRTWLWLMVGLSALFFAFIIGSARREVFQQQFTFAPGTATEPSFVTPVFELTGRTSNVALYIHTDLDNNWAYFNLALIDEQSGHAFDFGREVSYYHDSDGSEGGRNDHVLIPSVPSGRYYLRVEPEMNPKSTVPMNYEIIVRRDVPNYSFFILAALFLLIPPVAISLRARGFESTRWRESDFAPSSHSSSGDDD